MGFPLMAKSGLEDILPLSPLQEGMLFHNLFDEEELDAYNVQVFIDLEGGTDPERLRRAGQALLERHANLRAAFRHEGSSARCSSSPAGSSCPGARRTCRASPNRSGRRRRSGSPSGTAGRASTCPGRR